jgi:hypothetical protein
MPVGSPKNGININEEYVESVVKDERFKEIVGNCLSDCYEDCGKCDYEKCLRRCLRVAWVLYHAWYSSHTA